MSILSPGMDNALREAGELEHARRERDLVVGRAVPLQETGRNPKLLPGLGAPQFEGVEFMQSPCVPKGLAIATKVHEVVWFGPLRSIDLDSLPAGSKVNISPPDFMRINARLREMKPDAPEANSLKR